MAVFLHTNSKTKSRSKPLQVLTAPALTLFFLIKPSKTISCLLQHGQLSISWYTSPLSRGERISRQYLYARCFWQTGPSLHFLLSRLTYHKVLVAGVINHLLAVSPRHQPDLCQLLKLRLIPSVTALQLYRWYISESIALLSGVLPQRSYSTSSDLLVVHACQ